MCFLQSEERCRCALRFSVSFPQMSVMLSSLSAECLALGRVRHKTNYVQNVHGIPVCVSLITLGIRPRGCTGIIFGPACPE